MKSLVYLFTTLFFVSCAKPKNTEGSHDYITFINKTNMSLYIHPDSYGYPIPDSYKTYVNSPVDGNKVKLKIEPNESNTKALTAYNWERAYEPINTKSGIIMFYVFDAKTYDEKGWDYIKANSLVLKRYDLSLQDLKNSNWTISYP